MNTDMQALSRAYQKGVEVGRAAAKHEMDEFMALTKAFNEHITIVSSVDKAAKTIIKARGAQKTPGPRVTGVKDGIMSLIASQAMSASSIIAKTGFKGTSVRATLMSLKKAGIATNEAGLWIAAGHVSPSGGGNSEADVRAEY